MKLKLTKRVYFDDNWWKVVRVFTPTKHDSYIVLARTNAVCHDDGTPRVDMVLIDPQNDVYYPDTPRVRQAIARHEEAVAVLEAVDKKDYNLLTEAWLTSVGSSE